MSNVKERPPHDLLRRIGSREILTAMGPAECHALRNLLAEYDELKAQCAVSAEAITALALLTKERDTLRADMDRLEKDRHHMALALCAQKILLNKAHAGLEKIFKKSKDNWACAVADGILYGEKVAVITDETF